MERRRLQWSSASSRPQPFAVERPSVLRRLGSTHRATPARMVALAFAFLMSLAVAVYLIARNRDHWREMTWWHRWMVLMVCVNTAILGIAFWAAMRQQL